MLIAIIGTQSAGKSSVQQFLVERYNFQAVGLESTSTSDADATLLSFKTPQTLLDYVTENWLNNFVTCDLTTPSLIDPFLKRPFFLLVSVDAPVLVRFNRMRVVYPTYALERFIAEHDASFYDHPASSKSEPESESEVATTPSHLHLRKLFRQSHLSIINDFSTVSDLHAHLYSLDLPNQERLRPKWDTYFMTLASLASQRSNCMKRRVGAILVRDRRILATGYNGTPRNLKNCNEGGCKRCNTNLPSGTNLTSCLCLHAEENALLEAGRERVGVGCVLYCNTCPCLGCAIKIVQTGVREVVYNLSYKVDDRTEALFEEAGVVLRQHSPPEFE